MKKILLIICVLFSFCLKAQYANDSTIKYLTHKVEVIDFRFNNSEKRNKSIKRSLIVSGLASIVGAGFNFIYVNNTPPSSTSYTNLVKYGDALDRYNSNQRFLANASGFFYLVAGFSILIGSTSN